MKSLIATHKMTRSLLAVGLALVFYSGVPVIPVSAHIQKAGGTGRQSAGQPLRVMVMLNSMPFAGAQVIISGADSTVVVRGVSGANGVFTTTSLNQGYYAVTATNALDVASAPVTIMQSTDPAIVTLNLAPTQQPL